MIALIIILLVLFLLTMLWLGVEVRLSDSKLTVWARVLFFRVKVYPMAQKPSKKTPKQKKPKAEETESAEKPKAKRDYKALIKLVLRVCGRLKRKLVVKRLVFHYVAGGSDPCDTALKYGSVSAAIGTLLPAICGTFNVKHRDVAVNVDFDAPKTDITLELVMGFFLWQIVYIGIMTLVDYYKLKSSK